MPCQVEWMVPAGAPTSSRWCFVCDQPGIALERAQVAAGWPRLTVGGTTEQRMAEAARVRRATARARRERLRSTV